MPRLVFISDTHTQHKKLKLPDGDILVHSGDISYRGSLDEVQSFCIWVDALLERKKYKNIVWSCGNHDFLFEKNPTLARSTVKFAGTYLQDEAATIQGIKFYGSPWQPWFYDWAFNLKRGAQLKEKWDMIPADTDVLITHGPPYMILDKVPSRNTGKYDPIGGVPGHVGCLDLAIAVNRIKPKVHVFGHIHEGYGRVEKDGVTYINASSCDGRYDPINPPVVIDL